MCPKAPKTETVIPAAAPAAPLPVAEEVGIGKTRKAENVAVRGSKDVTYRRPEGMEM